MPEPYQPQFEETTLDISNIECKVFSWIVPQTYPVRRAGLIMFSGFYRRGSEGSPDARFICWRIKEFTEHRLYPHPFNISGLVVDFRKLDYVWGDNLAIPAIRMPVLVIVPSEAEDPEHYGALKWAIGDQILRTNSPEAFGEMNEWIIRKNWKK